MILSIAFVLSSAAIGLLINLAMIRKGKKPARRKSMPLIGEIH